MRKRTVHVRARKNEWVRVDRSPRTRSVGVDSTGSGSGLGELVTAGGALVLGLAAVALVYVAVSALVPWVVAGVIGYGALRVFAGGR